MSRIKRALRAATHFNTGATQALTGGGLQEGRQPTQGPLRQEASAALVALAVVPLAAGVAALTLTGAAARIDAARAPAASAAVCQS